MTLSRREILFGAAALVTTALAPRFALAVDDPLSIYDNLLDRYVVVGDDGVARVRYAAWKRNADDLGRLNAIIAALSDEAPSTLQPSAAFAYWTNLYNTLTLKVVLDAYPVRSIKNIKSTGTGFDLKAFSGPWRTKLVEVEGVPMSLDDIEHDTMRPTFRDPRVHYAVNCASIGCPNLKGTAWRAATLDADLNAAARAYVNHPRGVTIRRGRSLRVSSLYRWFKEDFGSSDAGVIRHMQGYADEPLASQLGGFSRIGGTDYDWSLNDA
ncbi:DUF547 domain-containing protein [Bauldia sp.]|uniref:DUF547 domain-containing protein n=1 Tax=Bauldia sp. TaxID=2575872 RepID=UPI003BAD0A34